MPCENGIRQPRTRSRSHDLQNESPRIPSGSCRASMLILFHSSPAVIPFRIRLAVRYAARREGDG